MAKRATLTAPQVEPLEGVLDDIRVLLEAKRLEYQTAVDRISDILGTLAPKPRIGRPPKVR